MLRALRGHTVHVDPWEVSAISAYGFRWRPLTVPQSYSAYTSVLDERNASFLASTGAPQRILRENPAELVNGRDRSLEAPASYRAIVCDYRQLLATTRWQVLIHDPRCGAPRHLATVAAAAGQSVTVPDARANELVVVHVDLHDSLANRVRGLLYKPHEAVVSLSGGPFTAVAADVVRDGIVVHVPGSAGFDPRFGGAIDWRTIAAGGLSGSITFSFDAIPVRSASPPAVGERAPLPLPRYTLERRGGGDVIVTPAGRALPVAAGGGFVDYGYVRRGTLVLSGWAADVAKSVPARTVLVFADGRLVFAGPPGASAAGCGRGDREAGAPSRRLRCPRAGARGACGRWPSRRADHRGRRWAGARGRVSAVLRLAPAVVASGQEPLEPDVQDDERVAAPHLLELELRPSGRAIRPGDREHRELVTARDCLERQLDRQVELIGQEGLRRLDYLAAVRLERVRRVVVAVTEAGPGCPR